MHTTPAPSAPPVPSDATFRPRVYIAGPISRGDLAHNVNQATAAFVALARAGFAPWCPQWSVFSASIALPTQDPAHVVATGSAAGAAGLAHADWMAVDLPWVAVSDAVLRLPGDSPGADREVACARVHAIPVYFSLPSLLETFPRAAPDRPHQG